MIKMTLFFSYLCFLFIPIFGNEISEKVKSMIVSEYTFQEQFGSFEAILKTKVISYYDSSGKRIAKEEYDWDYSSKECDNVKDTWYVYEYDDMGGQISYQEFNKYRRANAIFWKNEYDSLGNLTKEYAKDDKNKPINNRVYRYDSNKNKIETSFYKGDSEKLTKRIKYKYDSMKHLVDESEYNTKGELISKIKYTYSSGGKILNRVEYDGDGKAKSRKIYTYSVSGKLELIEVYKRIDWSTNLYIDHQQVYNQFEQVIKLIQFNQDNSVAWITFFSTDDLGNINSAHKYQNGTSLMYKVDYQYNEKNELIEVIESKYEEIYGEQKAIPYKKVSNEFKYY